MRKLITIMLIVIVVVMAGATFYTCSMLFKIKQDIKKGSFSYYIFLPQYIKDFPIVDPISDPSYYSIPIDVHPGYNGVIYKTKLDYGAAYRDISHELNNQGFIIQEEQIVEGEYVAFNSDKSLDINIVITVLEGGEVEIRAYEVYW